MPAQPPQRPGCPAPDRRPLPDPRAVRRFLIPDAAPPYDGEASPPARAGEPEAGSEAGGTRNRQGGGTGAAPASPPAWPGRFAQVLAETLAGSRPSRQIVPWTTERARDHIQRLGPQLASGQQPRVRRVITFHPSRDVLEMSVVVGFGPRVRALAVRLERAGPPPAAGSRPPEAGRWLCTAVEAA